jgi:hypothetical protein
VVRGPSSAPSASSAPGASSVVRGLFSIHALLYGALGLVLLLLPAAAIRLWPWAMTEPLSQVYSAWFITLAVACALAAREPDWDGARLVAVALLALAVLVVSVSLLHVARFKPGVPTLVWFGFFGAEALTFGWLLLRRGALASDKEVTA